MGLALPIPKQDFVAVGQKHKWHVGLLGVPAALFACVGGVDALALGLNDGEAPTLPAAQHVICAVAIGQGVFVANAGAIADLPLLVVELGVYQGAGECFGLAGHVFKSYKRRANLVDYPELLIIIVPRHPERFDAVFQLAQDLPLTTQRRSLGQRIEAESQVYLADSMGEMWLWYALSCVCFVGGSLNEPGGGHNILEPMALNIPTVIGPNYFNFQTIVDELIKADAILLGQEVNQVAAQLIQCVQQPEQAQRLSEHAAAIMQKNSGSLQKHIQVIDEYLAKKPAF